jgi:hypothetical protein
MKRVLQIIHVTDLHVGSEGASAEARHARERNRLSLYLTEIARQHNVFGWNEGTQTHFPYAPATFKACLEDLRASEPEWFEKTPTWLVDTGDLTTFGDLDSIREGKQYIKEWAEVAGAHSTRELYGNHDAWPACQPLTRLPAYSQDLLEQRGKLTEFDAWQPQRWLSSPLRARIPIEGIEAEVQLYALDTIGWEGWRNGRAVGSIDPRDITELQDLVEERRTGGHTRDVRILATHHPISFPYESSEIKICGMPLHKMCLANPDQVTRRLRSARPASAQDPYVHLMMSGHIHARYPGGPFDGAARKMQQKGLNSSQLQLVGSSLMLNHHRQPPSSARATAQESASRSVAGFDPVVLDHGACQADLLRFTLDKTNTANSSERCTLLLERTPIVSSTAATEYRLVPAKRQHYMIEF